MVNETIYEDGNGGQLYLKNNDIARTDSLYHLAYLEMFSGNVEADTLNENNPGELRLDWWGNDQTENSSTWINSQTERVLRNVELGSRSLARIRQAVENDIEDLAVYGETEVTVTLPAVNKVSIKVSIKEPGKKQANTLILIWDSTKREIIEQKTI